MGRFLATRALGTAGVLLALVTIVFLLQAVIPGDPVRAKVGANASADVVAKERERLGLDRPLPAQYVDQVGDVARGRLGESIRTSRPVEADLAQFLPATVELAAFTLALAVASGLLIGVLGATASRGASASRLGFVAGASVPSFLLALALIYVFYYKLAWLPASGRTDIRDAPVGPTGLLLLDGLLALRPAVIIDGMAHLALPAISLALVPAVAIGRVLRSSLVEVYRQDYIRTAEAKGLSPRRVLWRHAMRNSLSAPLTVTGLQLGLLLGGVVVVETVFAWPGIGLYMNQSIGFGDLTAIAGVTLVVGAGYVVINALVDVAQAVADPRIRL